MVDVHFVNRSQPTSNFPGSPLRVDHKKFALTPRWCCTAMIGFIPTHAATIGQLVNVIPEPGQFRFYFTRLFPGMDKLQAC